MDDIPDDDQDDDTTLPIASHLQQQPQVVPKVEGQLDTDIKPPMLPRVIGHSYKNGTTGWYCDYTPIPEKGF